MDWTGIFIFKGRTSWPGNCGLTCTDERWSIAECTVEWHDKDGMDSGCKRNESYLYLKILRRSASHGCTSPCVWETTIGAFSSSIPILYVLWHEWVQCDRAHCAHKARTKQNLDDVRAIARDVRGRCPIVEGSSDIPRRMESDWLLTCVYLPCFWEHNFLRNLVALWHVEIWPFLKMICALYRYYFIIRANQTQTLDICCAIRVEWSTK